MIKNPWSIDALLADGTPEIARRYTCEVGVESALERATTWASDENPDVREMAFMILGDAALDHPPALNRLLALAPSGCTDPDATVRLAGPTLAVTADTGF